MFTTPAAAATSPGLATSATSATSPILPTSSRSSRLRGLNYLRNYTHGFTREQSSSNSGNGSRQAVVGAGNHQPQQSSATAAAAAAAAAVGRSIVDPTEVLARFDILSRPTVPHRVTSPADSPSSNTTSHVQWVNGLTIVPNPNNGLVARVSSAPTVRQHNQPASPEPLPRPTELAAALLPPSDAASASAPAPVDIMTRTRSVTTTDAVAHNGGAGSLEGMLPTIRFSAFYDTRAPRPSLNFAPVARTLPTGTEIIRVGRYSERDNQPIVPINTPSAAPVGFKSKVVSRRHCEFWYEAGKWYIKDVKSSSGTFLNHIRLSPPGTESRPFAVNDGDIVQLGIDFKGGEEMIFRCVKMRLELNRGWQNKLNTFNMATHKRLRNMTSSNGNDSATTAYSQDCSICLNRIAPCQCLFVAPCSHTWHYKCIRALLKSPNYPIFQCPNCRAAADLEADIEDPEEWEQLDSEDGDQTGPEGGTGTLQVQGGSSEAQPRKSRESARSVRSQRSSRVKDTAAAVSATSAAQAQQQQPLPPLPPAGFSFASLHNGTNRVDANGDATIVDPSASYHASSPFAAARLAYAGNRASLPHSVSDPVAIPSSHQNAAGAPSNRGTGTRTPSPPNGQGNVEGPITPRNDAGPWVFDGSGVRIASLEDAVARDDTA